MGGLRESRCARVGFPDEGTGHRVGHEDGFRTGTELPGLPRSGGRESLSLQTSGYELVGYLRERAESAGDLELRKRHLGPRRERGARGK